MSSMVESKSTSRSALFLRLSRATVTGHASANRPRSRGLGPGRSTAARRSLATIDRVRRSAAQTPGHALRLRDRHHRRYLRRSLGSGGTAAPERESLALLPSGPDAVRTLPVRGTRSSTLRAQTQSRRTVPRTAFGPAWSGFRVQGTADSPPSAAGQAEGSTLRLAAWSPPRITIRARQ